MLSARREPLHQPTTAVHVQGACTQNIDLITTRSSVA